MPLLLFQQLPGVCIVAAECVAAMSADRILQMHFLQVSLRSLEVSHFLTRVDH